MAADPGRTPNPPSEQLSDAAPMSTKMLRSGDSSKSRTGPSSLMGSVRSSQGKCTAMSVQSVKSSGSVHKDYLGDMYIRRMYTYGEDMKMALETLTMPTLVAPEDPPDGATLTEKKIWEEWVKQYMRRWEDILTCNL